MSYQAILPVSLVALLTLALQPAAAQPGRIELHKEVTAATVNDAIRMGVGYLHSKQQSNGSWSDFESPGFVQPGAITALMTLALLNCGERVDEPHVAKALEFLEKQNPPGST